MAHCQVVAAILVLLASPALVAAATSPSQRSYDAKKKVFNPLCGKSPTGKALKKGKCSDADALAHCTDLAQQCNSTWASASGVTSLVDEVNKLEAEVNILGDIITSLVGVIEGIQTVQVQQTTGLANLAASSSQTGNQVYNQIYNGGWNQPPLPPHDSAVCTNWNNTLQSNLLVFFTVKDLSLPFPQSTNCSDAISVAFAASLVADYKANIEECADSKLTIGNQFYGNRDPSNWPGTPILGSDYGCVSTSSNGNAGGALYYASVAPLSRFPCAYESVENIIAPGRDSACNGAFAQTCKTLTDLTGPASDVVDVSSNIIRSSILCSNCLVQQSPSSVCYPRGKSYA
ncbi:hypothetical protein Rsub_02445 [Raphidocelis subcapitata]|uniref:Uncharacterized protein n=1 Tax=Raphidocelis subcapitata TaxID=307507 RepID=A0A2V0NSN5_9CHLO|nr:hypothetical protein Rsub_02445 [Raphidocelis subcapitata]|eukprot:GBF90339.1 hypothetical protein Rsub_02445 [Raphidocelis subcapitata]